MKVIPKKGNYIPTNWEMGVSAAAQGFGVALLPPSMFAAEMQQGRLVQPFAVSVSKGRYWLTRLKSRAMSTPMAEFRQWLLAAANGPGVA